MSKRQHSSSVSHPYVLSASSSDYSLSLGDGVSVDVPLKAEHSIVPYSSALRPVISLCINCHPLQREASLAKTEDIADQ